MLHAIVHASLYLVRYCGIGLTAMVCGPTILESCRPVPESSAKLRPS